MGSAPMKRWKSCCITHSDGFRNRNQPTDSAEEAERIDWSCAVVDGSLIRAVFGGQKTCPNATDRAKLGSKRHLICDGQGVPLAIQLTGANRNDSQEALALVDSIPPLQ